ncbi:hypothetical protein [Nitrincola sp.]|uniref:hypothetical protein n=1 Tax=Nitrincola sp. TaxID=1926584 RepID=UPI003A92F1F0
MEQRYKHWIPTHLEEIFTAILTAFFTALMFRVGMGMFLSIIGGLVIAYMIRLVAVPKAVRKIKQRLSWSDESKDSDSSF